MSNDELLEILANSQNLDVIQQHLKTCFDNLVKLEFQEVDILAMYSNEGEKVNFSKPLKARGQVEQWLESVQVGVQPPGSGAFAQVNERFHGNSCGWPVWKTETDFSFHPGA